MRKGVLEKKEGELSKPDQPTKRFRTCDADSSSPSGQPPPPGPTPHFHTLPDEVLEKIFRLANLKTIANVLLVCQRWRDLIEDWNFIKKLKFEGIEVTTQEALRLIRSAHGLKSLQLDQRYDTKTLLDAVSTRCTNLLHLSVWFLCTGVPLADTLRKVFQSNPRITDLRLKYISTSKNLWFWQELGTALPDLRKLEFHIFQLSDLELDALIDTFSRNQMEEFKAHSKLWSEESVAKLVQFWGRSLRVLEFRTVKLTDAALARLADCSELRRLKLVGLSTPGDCLRHLASLSHLEELHMALLREIKSENWCSFFSQSKSSQELRTLSLRGGSGVDDRVLASIAASCQQLEQLEATTSLDATISGVREVLSCCRKLHTLILHNENDRVNHVVSDLPHLAPQLRRICIGPGALCTVGIDAIRRVEAQMPHLTIDFDTRACNWLDSEAWM